MKISKTFPGYRAASVVIRFETISQTAIIKIILCSKKSAKQIQRGTQTAATEAWLRSFS